MSLESKKKSEELLKQIKDQLKELKVFHYLMEINWNLIENEKKITTETVGVLVPVK